MPGRLLNSLLAFSVVDVSELGVAEIWPNSKVEQCSSASCLLSRRQESRLGTLLNSVRILGEGTCKVYIVHARQLHSAMI